MTTEDTDIQQTAAEAVIRDEQPAVAPAPVSDRAADGELSAPEAISANAERVGELASSGEAAEPNPASAGQETSLPDNAAHGEDGDEVLPTAGAEVETAADAEADPMPTCDGALVSVDEGPEPDVPEPPPPRPIQLILWNEKVPASAGCWVFWREAGFECRGKIEKGLFTATCKGYGGAEKSQPIEILLRRRFVSQGEAIAVMDRMLSFDPHEAEHLGFEIHGRAMIPFLPTSGTLDEEQPAVSR